MDEIKKNVLEADNFIFDAITEKAERDKLDDSKKDYVMRVYDIAMELLYEFELGNDRLAIKSQKDGE